MNKIHISKIVVLQNVCIWHLMIFLGRMSKQFLIGYKIKSEINEKLLNFFFSCSNSMFFNIEHVRINVSDLDWKWMERFKCFHCMRNYFAVLGVLFLLLLVSSSSTPHKRKNFLNYIALLHPCHMHEIISFIDSACFILFYINSPHSDLIITCEFRYIFSLKKYLKQSFSEWRCWTLNMKPDYGQIIWYSHLCIFDGSMNDCFPSLTPQPHKITGENSEKINK